MSVERWLQHFSREYRALRDEERTAIRDFAVLWSFLESRAFGNYGNQPSIERAVKYWFDRRSVDGTTFRDEIAWFRSRYYLNGQETEHLRTLYLERNEFEQFVKATLKNDAAPAYDAVLAAFFVVYRYRNNLFHGEKEHDGFEDQFENFTHANALMMKALEINERSPVPIPPRPPRRRRF